MKIEKILTCFLGASPLSAVTIDSGRNRITGVVTQLSDGRLSNQQIGRNSVEIEIPKGSEVSILSNNRRIRVSDFRERLPRHTPGALITGAGEPVQLDEVNTSSDIPTLGKGTYRNLDNTVED